ncbi:hypothetical protein RN001_003771 [Aquatica leii]|uniref:Uncharacterized protein n=1 Tax=Aquatica leii TaxID=1421715 RepID=A0AAN7PFL2_9COLE|nr:hypothetical protein RN001_003771 [Aquatica leii]
MSFVEREFENQVKAVVEEFLFESDDETLEELMETSLETSSLSSSSNSSDDSFCEPVAAIRIRNFLEIADMYSETEFKSHFRICRQTGEYLIQCSNDKLGLSTDPSGREKVTPKEAIYMMIWYLANNETFRQLSDRFNKSKSRGDRGTMKQKSFYRL